MTNPMLGATAVDRRQLYENIRQMLETERSSFISLWRDLNDYVLPTRGRFQTTDANRGDRRSHKIIDSTATLAARTLGAGMVTGITNAARPWFRLTTPDPDMAERGAVKAWLHLVTARMRWVLARSNFYNKCPSLYSDLGVFGTGAQMSVEDERSVIRFIDFPLGSFSVANGPDDRPAVITRLFRMTVRQLVMEFGIDKVSEPVKSAWQRGNSTESWYEVVHIVLRNDEYEPHALLARANKPWLSCYYEPGSPTRSENNRPQFLRESGFDEMPFFVPVWETTGEDVYGTNSPGITALGDARQLQSMERRGLQGLEKMVNPPMTGPTALRNVRTSILPGDITYVDVREGQQGFRAAHETQIRLDQLEQKENGVRSRINESFYVNLFQMLRTLDDEKEGRGQMTAAEIAERHEEKLLVLGPVLDQLNIRWLDPVVQRTFAMMARRGFVPPPPPDLPAGALKVEYISMMHQAQKASQMGGYTTLLNFASGAAKLDPSVADKVDLDKMIEHVSESAGNPPDVVRPQEKVEQIRNARAQAAQEQRKIEQLGHEADAAKKLSQAQTGGKTALSDVLQAVSQNTPGSSVGAGGAGGAS